MYAFKATNGSPDSAEPNHRYRVCVFPESNEYDGKGEGREVTREAVERLSLPRRAEWWILPEGHAICVPSAVAVVCIPPLLGLLMYSLIMKDGDGSPSGTAAVAGGGKGIFFFLFSFPVSPVLAVFGNR